MLLWIRRKIAWLLRNLVWLCTSYSRISIVDISCSRMDLSRLEQTQMEGKWWIRKIVVGTIRSLESTLVLAILNLLDSLRLLLVPNKNTVYLNSV